MARGLRLTALMEFSSLEMKLWPRLDLDDPAAIAPFWHCGIHDGCLAGRSLAWFPLPSPFAWTDPHPQTAEEEK